MCILLAFIIFYTKYENYKIYEGGWPTNFDNFINNKAIIRIRNMDELLVEINKINISRPTLTRYLSKIKKIGNDRSNNVVEEQN